MAVESKPLLQPEVIRQRVGSFHLPGMPITPTAENRE